jgi:hypothetical protein
MSLLNISTPAEAEDQCQIAGSECAPCTHSAIAKGGESAMRRYFYKTLAPYLSLYIRPEDQIVEIAPRSAGLGERFAKYRAASSIATFKMTHQPLPDYVLLNGTIHYERDIQEMLNQLQESLEGSERILFVYYSFSVVSNATPSTWTSSELMLGCFIPRAKHEPVA